MSILTCLPLCYPLVRGPLLSKYLNILASSTSTRHFSSLHPSLATPFLTCDYLRSPMTGFFEGGTTSKDNNQPRQPCHELDSTKQPKLFPFLILMIGPVLKPLNLPLESAPQDSPFSLSPSSILSTDSLKTSYINTIWKDASFTSLASRLFNFSAFLHLIYRSTDLPICELNDTRPAHSFTEHLCACIILYKKHPVISRAEFFLRF